MEPQLNVSPELAPVLEQLRQLEPLVYAANDGKRREYFERLLSPGFWEVGASGRRYSREFVLGVLEERQRNPVAEEWQATDFHLQEIADRNYLLTYTLVQPARKSRRATIWRRAGDGWTVVYHQGTVVHDP